MKILNPERLQRRMHGRAQAEAILSLVDLPHEQCIDAFLDELQRRLKPPSVADKARKEGTIRELAATAIEFGKHAGKTFGEVESVDREYLEWLCGSSRELVDNLGTYLELTGEVDDGE